MKLLKAATAVALVCVLMVSMTGCNALDYRDAIDLYNAQDYAAAAEIFSALGDYEDSPALHTDCQYWMAVALAQQGNFRDALPRFQALGNHENSAQWVTECQYQNAIAAFNENNFKDAEILFGETQEYKSTQEYLRQITWQKFFDTVAELPLYAEIDGTSYSLTANVDSNQLEFYAGTRVDSDFTFHNDLKLTLSRDSLIANFVATDAFSMAFHDDAIGSQQSISGRVDIATCSVETIPLMESFEKTVQDNQGNTTTSTAPADSAVTDALLETFRGMMTVIPELIAGAGYELTLSDIGFSAM